MVKSKKYSDEVNGLVIIIGILAFICSLIGGCLNIALLCKLAFSDLTFWSYAGYASCTNLFLMFTTYVTLIAFGHTINQIELGKELQNEKRS